MPIHSVTSCSVCGKVIVESIQQTRMGETLQNCCQTRAKIEETEVDADFRLEGFMLGERIEAQVYRGGRTDDDGITTGSKLVTKVGRVSGVDVVGQYRSLHVVFTDGDFQVMSMNAENGKVPGYPCATFRRVAN